MDQKKTGQSTTHEQGKPQSGSKSVLTDKEDFGHSKADEKLKHMGEKASEAQKGKGPGAKR